MKLCYIHAYRHRFGVEPICAVLSEHGMTIAPQTYYRWLACPIRPAELEAAYLVNTIVDIYRRNKCVYGVRKMRHTARRAGLGPRPGGEAAVEGHVEGVEGGIPADHPASAALAGGVEAYDRQVDALERGRLVGEVTAGLDRPTDPGVHAPRSRW